MLEESIITSVYDKKLIYRTFRVSNAAARAERLHDLILKASINNRVNTLNARFKWPRNSEMQAINRQGITWQSLLSLYFFFFCLTSVKSTSSFFLCLVIQKIASYNSYLEAAEDWNGVLEHSILPWYIQVIKHLHYSFFVINENESALIIGLKLKLFFWDDE